MEVFLNGLKLPLLSTAPSEIRAQLPYELDAPGGASLYVRMEREDGTVAVTNAVAVKMLALRPVCLHSRDLSREAEWFFTRAPIRSSPVRLLPPRAPARPGEVLAVWTAGLGAVDDSDAIEPVAAGQPFAGPDAAVLHAVTATVNGRAASVVAAQLPQGSIGIYQVRIVAPSRSARRSACFAGHFAGRNRQ